MTGLALRSLRHRAPASAATFLTVLLGALLIGSFAGVATAADGPVSDTDAGTLVVLGAVVGAWGALIVLFSVVSTVGITVRQRQTEIGLLRTVGATPRQARRLVRAEVLVVAGVAATLGAALSTVTGRGLLALLRGPMVADDVPYQGGALAPVATVVLLVLTSTLAAGVAGRRATRRPASLVVADAEEGGRLPWWRVGAGLLLIAYGIAGAVVTVTVTRHSDDPYAAMQTSGSAAILVGVGLAVVAPVLLRWGTPLVRPLLGSDARRPPRRPAHAAPLAPAGRRARPHDRAGGLGGERADDRRHRRPHPRRLGRARGGRRGDHPAQLRRHRDAGAVRRDHGGQRVRGRAVRTPGRAGAAAAGRRDARAGAGHGRPRGRRGGRARGRSRPAGVAGDRAAVRAGARRGSRCRTVSCGCRPWCSPPPPCSRWPSARAGLRRALVPVGGPR